MVFLKKVLDIFVRLSIFLMSREIVVLLSASVLRPSHFGNVGI